MPVVNKVPYGENRGVGNTLHGHSKRPLTVGKVHVVSIFASGVGMFTLPTLLFSSSTFILPLPNMLVTEFSLSTIGNLFTLFKIFKWQCNSNMPQLQRIPTKYLKICSTQSTRLLENNYQWVSSSFSFVKISNCGCFTINIDLHLFLPSTIASSLLLPLARSKTNLWKHRGWTGLLS